MPRTSVSSQFRTQSTAEIRSGSHDRRTVSSTRAAARAAAARYRPKEIGARLGISYQKWGAIQKGIRKGKIYGPEIRDKLNQVAEGRARVRPPVSEMPRIYQLPEGIRYTRDSEELQKRMPWAKEQKREITLKAMRKYVEKIPRDYFIVARVASTKQPGRYYFVLFDTRTPSELQHHNRGRVLDRETKAEEIYRDFFDERDEEIEDD